MSFLNALSDLRLEDAANMMHEDSMFQLMTVSVEPNKFSGQDMLKFVTRLNKALAGDGFRFEVLQQTAEADRVSSLVEAYSTNIDGEAYNNQYHFLHTIRDGKIIEQLEYFDSYLGAKVMGPLLQKLSESEAQ